MLVLFAFGTANRKVSYYYIALSVQQQDYTLYDSLSFIYLGLGGNQKLLALSLRKKAEDFGEK